MNFKKIKGKIYAGLLAFGALAAASGLPMAFAETVDLSVITDILPTLITLMVVSAVIGMLKNFGHIGS